MAPPRSDTSAPDSLLSRCSPYLLLVGLWALLHGCLGIFHGASVFEGELADTDAYMRLVRVTELYETASWFDNKIERSNAPHGETLHWTRPFDVLLIAGASLFSPFFGFDTGLFWFGAIISPLLQLMTSFAFVWAVAPLAGRAGRFLAAIVLFLQPAALAYSTLGRADHHALLFLVFVVMFGFTVRALARASAMRPAVLAGAAAGGGLWLSVELLAAVVACLATMTLAWLLEGGTRARQSLGFAAALCVVVGLALVAERPPANLLDPAYDRISSVHFMIAGIAFTFWLAIVAAERPAVAPPRPGRGLGLVGLGALLGGAALYLVFPKFFLGPMVEVDPRIVPIWLDKVAEMKPIVPTSVAAIGRFILYFGPGLASVPFLVWLLVKERAGEHWLGWCCIGIGLAFLLPAAMAHARFAPFAEILLVMVLAELLDRFFAWTGRLSRDLVRTLVRSTALVAAFIGSIGVGSAVMAAGSPARDSDDPDRCGMRAIARHLNDPTFWPGSRQRIIAALIDFGPELLYRTGHAVIGTPYHRNGAGIFDSHRMLAASDDEAIRHLLRARGVDLILLCPSRAESAFFSSHAGEGSLYRRLLNGRVPDWVERVDLPGELDDTYHLYALADRLH